MATTLPAVTKVQALNPRNLPTSASSVIASKVEAKAFHTANQSPGILVFHRRGGLTHSNLVQVARVLSTLRQHPLPLEKGAIPFGNSGADALAHLTQDHHSTLVVPLNFTASSSNKGLQSITTDLGHDFTRVLGKNLLTSPIKGGGLSARLTGPTGISVDVSGLFSNADITLLASTTMLILILLLLIYRSPLLPWIPLVSVGLSYLVTSGILALLVQAHTITVDAETISIMTVLMFGAGTDYTLFVVSRYRSELWDEPDPIRALRRALSQVSGAVSMSAATVMVALLVLLVSIYGSDYRFAIPFAIAVGMTALASLTLVPALLSVLGRPAFWPYTPKPERRRPASRQWLASLVTQRRWQVLVVVSVLLGALALEATQIHTTSNLLAELPHNAPSVEGFRLLSRAEGAGSLSPVAVVVEGSGAHHDIRHQLQDLRLVQSVSAPQLSHAGGHPVALYQVALRTNPLSNAAMADLPKIQRTADAAVPAGTQVYLGGSTAHAANTVQAIRHDSHWVIPLVLIIIFALLLIYLRSLVAATYLIATVILSYFAALGAGWLLLHDILGISGWAGGVTLYAFVFLVALGEDYNIFMLSTIWSHRRNAPMTESIRSGIQQSGPVISAAGLILAGTFAVLTGLPLRILLEFGSVAAIGVLLDTFMVRSLLVPAITAILQDKALWPMRPPEQSAAPHVTPGAGL